MRRGSARAGARRKIFLQEKDVVVEIEVVGGMKGNGVVVENNRNCDEDVDGVDEKTEGDDLNL